MIDPAPVTHSIHPPPVQDAELAAAARAGDQAAFAGLMRLHYERVFRLVFSIVRHEADARDVCQEIWVAVWNQLSGFRGESRFTTWLHPIAVRRALDHLRRRRRWYERFLPFETGGIAETLAVDEPADAVSDQVAAVRRALDALPLKLRAVLALRELEGLSYDEIAEVMKIPAGTVMSRLHHARRLLAKKLGVNR